MNNILIISEGYIKQYSDVMQNVDPKQLRMHIFEAQDININYLLGDDLFDEFFRQFKLYQDAGGENAPNPIDFYVEARMLTLLDKLKRVTLYYTLYNATYSLYSRTTNKGINTQQSDFSNTTDVTYIEKIKKDWFNKAESYGKIVYEYLKDNQTTYPEFRCDDSDDSDDSGLSHSTYSGPLYLGDEI